MLGGRFSPCAVFLSRVIPRRPNPRPFRPPFRPNTSRDLLSACLYTACVFIPTFPDFWRLRESPRRVRPERRRTLFAGAHPWALLPHVRRSPTSPTTCSRSGTGPLGQCCPARSVGARRVRPERWRTWMRVPVGPATSCAALANVSYHVFLAAALALRGSAVLPDPWARGAFRCTCPHPATSPPRSAWRGSER